MSDNTKIAADLTRLLDHRDGATTKEFWSDLVKWYTNAQSRPAIDRPLIDAE
jgi:hypothetical protein